VLLQIFGRAGTNLGRDGLMTVSTGYLRAVTVFDRHLTTLRTVTLTLDCFGGGDISKEG